MVSMCGYECVWCRVSAWVCMVSVCGYECVSVCGVSVCGYECVWCQCVGMSVCGVSVWV